MDAKDLKIEEKFQKGGKDIFEHILEYLVAEGYADTNKAALVIMANMSEEWKQDIVEAAADQSDKQIERGIKPLIRQEMSLRINIKVEVVVYPDFQQVKDGQKLRE
jgi:hypothetical protein